MISEQAKTREEWFIDGLDALKEGDYERASVCMAYVKQARPLTKVEKELINQYADRRAHWEDNV